VRSAPVRVLSLSVAVAVAVVVLPSMAGAQQAEQAQLQQARDRLAELGREIDAASDAATSAEAELADADAKLREVEAVVNEVAAAVDRQQGAVREAEDRLAAVEAEAAEVAAAFADRASRMFKEGPNLPFETLLSSGGAEDAMTRTSYLRVITQADRVNIETLEAAETAVDAQRERLLEEQERLEAMLAEQQELLAEVERLRESRALAAADARDRVRQLEAEQDDLEEDQARLEALIRQKQEEARREAERRAAAQRAAEERAAEQRAADRRAAEQRAAASDSSSADSSSGSSSSGSSSSGSSSAGSSSAGSSSAGSSSAGSSSGSSSGGGSAQTSTPSSSGFAWPLCAPVTSEYGPRWGRMHRGIDQGASTGTPIGASKAGIVIFAGWQGGYGNLTLIDHHDGVVTAYAHQSRLAVSSGASVSQGQTIGYVGNTGNSTGPHLHFETRVNGSAVNPRQYLSGSPC
jgi:murein DD-endopeptidase MepM/ murein hydrolase activator NlpD